METVTRANVLAELAQRYRAHYRNRLAGLYALPNDPYEPEDEPASGAVDVVVVLQGPYPYFEESDAVARIADEVMREYDTPFVIMPHHVPDDATLVQRARRTGIEL